MKLLILDFKGMQTTHIYEFLHLRKKLKSLKKKQKLITINCKQNGGKMSTQVFIILVQFFQVLKFEKIEY